MKFANWTVQKGTELILENNELRKFGNAVVATNRINKNDDFCCCNAPTKNLSSAFCTKCVYVYEHKDLAVETFRFSRVDGPTTAAMIKTIELFFYRIWSTMLDIQNIYRLTIKKVIKVIYKKNVTLKDLENFNTENSEISLIIKAIDKGIGKKKVLIIDLRNLLKNYLFKVQIILFLSPKLQLKK